MKLRLAILGATACALVSTAPAMAQDANVSGRIKKLEKEMKAVQRVVFPNGAGKFFEPEIKPKDTAKPKATGSSPSAVTDLIARVDALETQLASLTGQVEQHGNSMQLMEKRLKAVEAGLKKQQAAVTAAAPVTTTPAVTSKPKPAKKATASNARKQGVGAIEKPDTGDAFQDSYIYGYRLWAAKYYPEAQVQLAATAKKFSKHKRASFARNLLGRSWLDEKKPATAVKIFYANYKDDPRGGRAPESLYFLGVALTSLGKATEACEAFGQLESAYPEPSEGRLANRLASGRSRAKCK